jgi:thioredoxin 1
MQALIHELDAKSFRAALKHKLLLVDFWEPWCGPCQVQLPVLEEVARHFGRRATIAKVNVDEAQKLAAHFGIQSLPTLVLFQHGRVVRQFAGSHSSKALIAAMEDAALPRHKHGASSP